MKKYITILTVFMAFLFSGQFMNAQQTKPLSTEQIKEKAQLDTKKLNDLVGLEGDQEKKVFEVYFNMETNLNAISQDERANYRIPVVMEEVDARLSKILNSKQYQIYLDNKEE